MNPPKIAHYLCVLSFGLEYIHSSRVKLWAKDMGTWGTWEKDIRSLMGNLINHKSKKKFQTPPPPPPPPPPPRKNKKNRQVGKKDIYVCGKENRRRFNLCKREANRNDGGSFKDKET